VQHAYGEVDIVVWVL